MANNLSIPPNLYIWLILFACLLLGALVFAVLAFLSAQKSNSQIARRFDLLENGIKHYFSNSRDIEAGLNSRIENFTQSQISQFSALRQENSDARAKLEESQKLAFDSFGQNQAHRLTAIEQIIKELSETNEKRGKEIGEALVTNLDKLREENSAKLEVMRQTVDEKLQGTLEKRLGESFKLVSDRLDAVHQGLGEMQTLATGVGDLKKVLTNVKSRGTWGEVQLEALLADMLTPDQFDKNVKINPNSGEIVEFAIKLPGKSDNKPIYIAIDSKFPIEDYERLINAQENGSSDDIDVAGKALEKAIKIEAKRIYDKYIQVPYSTDFAIMYLPTEGLFAEVIRRPTLMQEIQTKFRIIISGPTTLTATLSSLQMGFRTLAIEKRSSEVWEILGAAKAEFARYGGVWDKLKKQLETAQNTVEEAGKRTRAIERNLRSVESTQIPTDVEDVLALTFGESEEN